MQLEAFSLKRWRKSGRRSRSIRQCESRKPRHWFDERMGRDQGRVPAEARARVRMKVEDCCWTFRLHRGTRAALKLHAQARAQRRGGRCLELVVVLLLLRQLARRDAEAGRGLPRGRRARGCRVGRHWVLPRCLSLAGGRWWRRWTGCDAQRRRWKGLHQHAARRTRGAAGASSRLTGSWHTLLEAPSASFEDKASLSRQPPRGPCTALLLSPPKGSWGLLQAPS